MVYRTLFFSLALFLSTSAGAPGAWSYPCFYESSAPIWRGAGQTLLAGVVDAGTGAFVKTLPCVGIPGPTPMRGDIFYNTQDNSNGPFGKGTSTGWDYFVRAAPAWPGTPYELIAPGNLHYVFDTNNAGVYSDTHDPALLGAALSFTSQPAGVWATLTWKGGARFQFDAFGGLIHMIDGPGNTIDIFRNQINGFAATVRSPTNTNRQIQYRQDFASSHVVQILAQYSYLGSVRRWNIAYDAANNTGKMVSLSDPLGRLCRFTWTSYVRSDGAPLPLLLTAVDPRGMTCLSLHYDSLGRVTAMDNATGGQLTYSYSAGIGAAGATTGIDPASGSTTLTYVWNANLFGYRVTQTRDNSLNETTTIAYTAAPTYLPTAATDYRGRTTTNTWNTANGDLLTATTPTAAGGTATTTCTYDSTYHKLLTVTDPTSRISRWSINATTGNVDSSTNPANEVTSYTYNGQGQVVTVSDPLGHVSTFMYDPYGLPTQITTPMGTHLTVVRNDLGQITQSTDELGNATYYSYDLAGHQKSVSVYPYPGAPANAILTNTYNYDPAGNVQSATDPAGHSWSWTYDCAGAPLSETNPLGQTRRWTWTPTRNLATYTDFAGNQTVGTYLTDGRMSLLTFKNPAGSVESTISYTYDSTSHLLASKVDSGAGTYSYLRDLLDQTTTYTEPNGNVTYQYDVLGRPTQIQPSGQNPITYTYHPRGTVATLAQDSATQAFNYNALGQLTQQTLSNGVVTTVTRDANGRITLMESAKSSVVFDSNAYTYDAAGKPTQVIATSGSTHNLSYNTFGQVTAITDPNTPANNVSYTYSPSGLRTTQTLNSVTTPYQYNSANQIIAVGSQPLVLNGNGSPTAYNGQTYTWNARRVLVGYTAPGTTLTTVYGPTAAPVSSVLNGVTTTTLYGVGGIAKQVVGGTPVHYLNGPVALIKSGANFVTVNPNRSTVALTNSSGTVVGNYGYDPFGLPTHTGTATTPIQFAGGSADTPSLLHAGRAVYQPELGLSLNRVGVAPSGPLPPGQGPTTSLPGSLMIGQTMGGFNMFGEGGVIGGGGGGGSGGGGGFSGLMSGFPESCGAPAGKTSLANASQDVLVVPRLAVPGANTLELIRSVSLSIGQGNADPCWMGEGAMSSAEFGAATGGSMDRGVRGFSNRNPAINALSTHVRIPLVIRAASYVNFNLDGFNQSIGFSKLTQFSPDMVNGEFTNAEFALCHSAQILPKVRWFRCGILQPRPPILTWTGDINPAWVDYFNGPQGGSGTTSQFITGPIGPYEGEGAGTAP